MNYAFVCGSFAGADRVSRIRLRRYSTRFDFDSSSECACARNQRIFPIVARRKIAIERVTIFRPRRRSMKVSRGNFSCTAGEEGKKEKEKRKKSFDRDKAEGNRTIRFFNSSWRNGTHRFYSARIRIIYSQGCLRINCNDLFSEREREREREPIKQTFT